MTKDNKEISKFDLILSYIYKFCKFLSKISGYAGGFLSALIVTKIAEKESKLSDVFSIFDVHSRILNILPWVAILIIILSSLGRILLEKYARKRSYNIRLAELYRDKVAAFLQPFQRSHISWGSALTLQSCPDLQSGWSIKNIQFQYSPIMLSLPQKFSAIYEEYKDSIFRDKHIEDKTRLMLTENPSSFSDSSSLLLKVQEVKWSYIRFYQDQVFQSPSERNQHINQILSGKINFPNSLCLHLSVVTRDNWLLMTEISNKSHYFPSTWQFSIAEQLDLSDLKGTDEKLFKKWVERTLREELGVLSDGFKPDNIKALAVVLEGEIVNCALISIVILEHDRDTLDAIIDKHPRIDYELQNWTFISWNDLAKELNKPARIYHPTSEIRMFYAGLFKFGAPSFNRRLVTLSNRKNILDY